MNDSPLNNIKIASPCSADWNAMSGDDKKRFCGECKLNVYNLSGMTKDEAENLIIETEGRLCVRFYSRADGTILTQDCPVGWAKVKRNISRAATATISLIISLFAGLIAFSYSRKTETPLMGKPAPVNINVEKDEDYCPPVTMGTPVPITRDKDTPIAGGITNIEEVREQAKKKRNR
jgi:hypothetical protein